MEQRASNTLYGIETLHQIQNCTKHESVLDSEHFIPIADTSLQIHNLLHGPYQLQNNCMLHQIQNS